VTKEQRALAFIIQLVRLAALAPDLPPKRLEKQAKLTEDTLADLGYKLVKMEKRNENL
jgi:hypothetical protein